MTISVSSFYTISTANFIGVTYASGININGQSNSPSGSIDYSTFSNYATIGSHNFCDGIDISNFGVTTTLSISHVTFLAGGTFLSGDNTFAEGIVIYEFNNLGDIDSSTFSVAAAGALEIGIELSSLLAGYNFFCYVIKRQFVIGE
jgi:hypothetical protein